MGLFARDIGGGEGIEELIGNDHGNAPGRPV
jgi:hypothetical protein